MEPLNTRMLNKALAFAVTHEFTSIAIMMDCQASIVAMRRSLLDQYINQNECICTYDRISFSNGSTIRLYAANDAQSIRGHRSNIVLVHSLVTDPLSISHIQTVENSQHGQLGKSYTYVHGLNDYCEIEIYDTGFSPPDTGCFVYDFGDFEPSSEILDYIGGLCG